MSQSSNLENEINLNRVDENLNSSEYHKSGNRFSEVSAAIDDSIASARRGIWSFIVPILRPTPSTPFSTNGAVSILNEKKNQKIHSKGFPQDTSGTRRRPFLRSFFTGMHQLRDKAPNSVLEAALLVGAADDPSYYISSASGGSSGDTRCDGGCFAGPSLAFMANGDSKPIEHLRKGDEILCDKNGLEATVVCIVAIPIPANLCRMVHFSDGLIITPTHPICHPVMGWVNPQDVKSTEIITCNRVFNILLDRGHTILMNGIVCATLGHKRGGYTQHEFWGDVEKVVRCLMQVDKEGIENGRVEVSRNLRNELTGRVCGFVCMDGRKVFDNDLA